MKPYLRITLWYLLFGGLWIDPATAQPPDEKPESRKS